MRKDFAMLRGRYLPASDGAKIKFDVADLKKEIRYCRRDILEVFRDA